MRSLNQLKQTVEMEAITKYLSLVFSNSRIATQYHKTSLVKTALNWSQCCLMFYHHKKHHEYIVNSISPSPNCYITNRSKLLLACYSSSCQLWKCCMVTCQQHRRAQNSLSSINSSPGFIALLLTIIIEWEQTCVDGSFYFQASTKQLAS